jgi:hypothetical protein
MDWKLISEIPGYEDYTNYELNIAGDLRNRKTGHLLKWSKRKDGYSQAQLNQKPFKPKHILKHVFICRLFLPNPENKPCVDHKIRDENNLDNSISNLRWATHAENSQNKSLSSANTSGEQHIYCKFQHGAPIWRIQIVADGKWHTKQFPRDPKYNVIPLEVIRKRDEMKRTYHPTAPVNCPWLNLAESSAD